MMETLVAVVLLGTTLSIILQLFSGGIKSLHSSELYQRGILKTTEIMETALALEKLKEQVREGNFSDGSVWRLEISEASGISNDNETGLGLFRIEAQVTFKYGSKQRTFKLNTLKLAIYEGEDDQG